MQPRTEFETSFQFAQTDYSNQGELSAPCRKAVQQVELWLVPKWATLYPNAKHAEMVGFDRGCDTEGPSLSVD